MICGLSLLFKTLLSLCLKPSKTTMGTMLKITLKSNSYLNYISCRGCVKLPTLCYVNINVIQIMTKGLVFRENHSERNGCSNLCLLLKAVIMTLKSNSHLNSISRRSRRFPSLPPTFFNINLTQATFSFENPSKMAEILSAFES